MIIDNKTTFNTHGIKSVADFIKHYSESTSNVNFDIVTGFFSIYGLIFLKNLPDNYLYRMILARMVNDSDERDHIIDLLKEDNSIEAILHLKADAKEAIDFLERQTVDVKTVDNAFCHAKTYIYKEDDERNDYYISGSSNLTEAGLGLKYSPNIEMNIAEHSETKTFTDLSKWFEDLWTTTATDKIILEDKTEISVKDFIINQIKKLFKDYTPEEIYYKILFELFQRDFVLGDIPLNDNEMKHLKDSQIWNTLYDYQKSGVISLIRMLQKYDGAILADAVGLGKTFSALAVMYYFQTNGYKVVMLCPKKLEHNWTQYLKDSDSRFDADGFEYYVRFHTDLQNDRLENSYDRAKLSFLKKQRKLLIVIDESHNLRNDKSNRYKYFVENLLNDDNGKKDIKTLLLSATPINNGLKDVRNQFNIIGKNRDNAFDNEEFAIRSLMSLFSEAQKKFAKWSETDGRKISDFINMLPQKFFALTDRLIVARTRRIIEKTLGEKLAFPIKEKPLNIYKCLDKFGKYKTTNSIYDALMNLSLTAYQPTQYREDNSDKKTWQDNRYREHFLVKMMTILFLKRLESSWYACMLTIQKVLEIHTETLNKVNLFLETHSSADIETEIPDDETDDTFALSKGRINLRDMGANINLFKQNLQSDIKKLQEFYDNILKYKASIESGKSADEKLKALIEIVNEKQKCENKKILIFTAYSDTAQYIFENFTKAGFKHVALITGTTVKDSNGETFTNFKQVTERFSPYSKLYMEKDYSSLYQEYLNPDQYYILEKKRWNVPFDVWKDLVKQHIPQDYAKLSSPIDILIATDCLSEGQNLQDADMVVNYDIHWNPVRLIQRLGRIDRLGSKNKSVKAVNFWPTTTFDAFINLTNRINQRMAAMVLINTETVKTDDNLDQMIEDNPLLDKNAEKLLRELEENKIEDLEDNAGTFSFADLSLELFRQDLLEYLDKHKDKFRNMPCGIFSGFKAMEDKIKSDSLVAVVGYPKKEDKKKHTYSELYLMLQPADKALAPQFVELNVGEILSFLRRHKNSSRYVPKWLDEESDPDKIRQLSQILCEWMRLKAPHQTQNTMLEMMSSNFTPKFVDQKEADTTIENKFKIENFDLIVWEYVTKKL